MAKKKSPSTGANPERAQAAANLRRSVTAGAHAQGARGTRTRGGAKKAAIRDSMQGASGRYASAASRGRGVSPFFTPVTYFPSLDKT